jgi:hypothetical protein
MTKMMSAMNKVGLKSSAQIKSERRRLVDRRDWALAQAIRMERAAQSFDAAEYRDIFMECVLQLRNINRA